MPHAMYFTGNSDTVTKINQIPYQTIQYNENGMFTTKLMNDTPIEIFIDNGASILSLFYLFYHYTLTTNFPFYTHTPKQKVTLPYTWEDDHITFLA